MARRIDYSKPLTPPLDPADANWLKRQMRDNGTEAPKQVGRRPRKKP